MARIELRPDLVASRYAALQLGPRIVYSFETQEGLPVDAGNELLRKLSPFTLRIVVPTVFEEETSVDVNLIGSAFQSIDESNAAANEVRRLFGISTVAGADTGLARETLQRIVSAGQIISGVTSTERAVLTDSLTAADIALQVENALNAPPLTLLVNTREMNITYNTVQQFQNRTRKGRIFERWGESQEVISFSGTTGGFMAAANPQNALGPRTTETSSVSGLQHASKRDSAAFQNFISLFQFYKNNGYIYDTVRGTEAHLMVGSIAIEYDQNVYIGHIDSFEYSYTADTPHRLEWSMEFTVDRKYDTAQAPITVLPMQYAGSSLLPNANPDAVSGGGLVQVSGTEQFSQTPLDLLIPSGV